MLQRLLLVADCESYKAVGMHIHMCEINITNARMSANVLILPTRSRLGVISVIIINFNSWEK